jgi:hypothetical protein
MHVCNSKMWTDATRKTAASQLKLQDEIFPNDVLQTSANSTLGVTFSDATTFNLTANARITVDSFFYEDGGKQNTALFDITKGTVAFVAAAVAKTGDMKISTPTAMAHLRAIIYSSPVCRDDDTIKTSISPE